MHFTFLLPVLHLQYTILQEPGQANATFIWNYMYQQITTGSWTPSSSTNGVVVLVTTDDENMDTTVANGADGRYNAAVALKSQLPSKYLTRSKQNYCPFCQWPLGVKLACTWAWS